MSDPERPMMVDGGSGLRACRVCLKPEGDGHYPMCWVEWAADEIERLRADRDRWRFMAMEGSVLTEREALELYEDVMGQADEIVRLREALQVIADGRWNVGTTSTDPPIKFARSILTAKGSNDE